MEQIHITKDMLNKQFFNDVLFVVYSGSSAMGNAGLVQFIKLDGNEYYFNYIKEDISLSMIEELFPPMKKLFRVEKIEIDNWHLIYLGIGTSMFINDKVFDTFKVIAKEYTSINHYKLFQNWRKIVLVTLDKVNSSDISL